MNLSPHFTVFELTRSDYALRHGIDNTPSAEVVANLTRLAQALEAIRGQLGAPLEISSGYRCPALNQAVGGVPAVIRDDGQILSGSYHLFGLAADLCAPTFGTPAMVAKALEGNLHALGIDKLILEYRRWVHVQIAPAGLPARCAAYTIDDKLSGYKPGIVA